MTRLQGAFFAALLALGVGAVSADGAADGVRVLDPYVRAVPPMQPNSAAFMVLANESADAHALIGAESDSSDVVELHGHFREDGMMKMRRVERVDLPAGQRVALEPGGLHLMLIGLKRQLASDQQIELTLVFEDGSRASIEAPVRGVEPATGGGGMPRRCGSGRCGSGRCGGGK